MINTVSPGPARACCEEQRGILPDAGILSTGFAWSEDIRARGGREGGGRALVDAREQNNASIVQNVMREDTHVRSIVMSINGGFNGNMVGGLRRCK